MKKDDLWTKTGVSRDELYRFVAQWCVLKGHDERLVIERKDVVMSSAAFKDLINVVMESIEMLEPSTKSGSVPSVTATFLFYLCLNANNCDALVGDLEERYKLMLEKFGRRKANFWYWTQAARSVVPIVWAFAKSYALKPITALIGSAVSVGLIKQTSWLATVVQLCKSVWKRG